MRDFVRKLEAEITSESEASLLSVFITARGYDLEAIMTDLETFISLEYVSTFVFDGFEATLEDANKLRSLIRHSIIREYRAIDTTKVVEIYRPLFDNIFSHVDSTANCLPIFTTNYDLAIEEFCKKQYPYQLVDGLCDSRDATWNQGEFERFRLYSELPYLVLFKLHGSVNWMRVTATGEILQSLAMYDAIDSDAYQNTVIYPAGNKIANLEPYLTAYHYFSRCCEHAKLIIAVGYSFRDYDALISLLRARQVNENLRLVILSPDAYDVSKRIDSEDNFFWHDQIFGYFGEAKSEAEYLPKVDELLSRHLKK
jgi:hypothetical protein